MNRERRKSVAIRSGLRFLIACVLCSSMKLSDYRGKVVVLEMPGFFTRGFIPLEKVPQFTVKRFRDLGRSIEAKPVAILGVASSHRDEYRKEVEEQQVPIRFW